MPYKDIITVLLVVQVPLVFGTVLHYHPHAKVLLPWMNQKKELQTTLYEIPLEFPCIFYALLLVFTGKRSLDWFSNSMGTYDCCEQADSAPENRLFWASVCAFAVVKSFLLMHYVDFFALILAAVFSVTALVVSCQPVDHNTMCFRTVGVTAFAASIMPVVLLALQHTKTSEAYVLAMTTICDALLIVGHTYDYPSCSMETVINCRVGYVCSLLILYPLCIFASCEVF